MNGFTQFWAAFPRRVGKLDAMKAYAKARKLATAEDILAGVQAYIAHKPDYADWSHPSTWLNKGRWMDEYDAPIQQPAKFDWYQECAELHNHECGLNQMKHHTRKILEEGKAS